MEIMFVCVPAIIVFLCFMPYRMKALSAMKLKSTRQREIGLILFIISIFGILALTLWPTYVWEESPGMWGNLRILIERPTWNFQLSLVPFTVFKDYAKDLFRSPVFFFTTLINLFPLVCFRLYCFAKRLGEDQRLSGSACLPLLSFFNILLCGILPSTILS